MMDISPILTATNNVVVLGNDTYGTRVIVMSRHGVPKVLEKIIETKIERGT